jgi:hypothetical protein
VKVRFGGIATFDAEVVDAFYVRRDGSLLRDAEHWATLVAEMLGTLSRPCPGSPSGGVRVSDFPPRRRGHMAGDDDQYASEGAEEGIDRPQDPIVASLRPDPAQPPEPVLRMSGFLGDSDRPGFRRLYFTRDIDYYAEFRVEDVVHMAAIPAKAPPFLGDEATV